MRKEQILAVHIYVRRIVTLLGSVLYGHCWVLTIVVSGNLILILSEIPPHRAFVDPLPELTPYFGG